eukprot:2398003-Alexandrium_andersonii.AAC.1
MRIVLGQRQEWFVKVEHGAIATVAGAGESATAPMPGAAWLRVVGPSTRRSIASWHTTRAAIVTAQGAVEAWSAPHAPPSEPAAPPSGGGGGHAPAQPAQAASWAAAAPRWFERLEAAAGRLAVVPPGTASGA